MADQDVIEHPDIQGGVVVGDDGSDASSDAVRWAVRDAGLRGVPLYIVRSWSIRAAPRPSTMTPGFVPPLRDFEAAVRAEMERRWSGLVAENPGVDVRLQPVHASAVKVLIEASTNADLVIVGSRGRGGFSELVLGSTADQVVRYAHCPVTVVRQRR